MKPTVHLARYSGNDKQSTGVLTVMDNNTPVFVRPSLERGYLDNQKNISAVPVGVYDLVFEWSPKFQMMLWELKGVPNRSECKIHHANFWDQLNGCISIGSYLKHIGRDDNIDLAASKRALNDFHRVMKDYTKTRIHITNYAFKT